MSIDLYFDLKQRYGATLIQIELKNNQQTACIKTISDSMRRQDLATKATRKLKVTTDSNHKLHLIYFGVTLLPRPQSEVGNGHYRMSIALVWSNIYTVLF